MTFLEKAYILRTIIEKAAQSLDDADALEAVTLYPKWAAGVSYPVGHRVRHEGILYTILQEHTSQATWTPDVTPSLYAKALIPDENKIYPWEQPDSTNSYKAGNIVSHNGYIWESDIDNNVWEPGVYGWTKKEQIT